MRPSTTFLLACVAAALVLTGYDALLKPAYRRLAYDDSPPIRFLSARLENDKLPAGAPEIRFSFVYDLKRPACHPPISEPGLIRFRIWTKPQDYIWLRYENHSYAPASSGRREMPFRSIPLPPLPPGTYSFQWVATYTCQGSSGPISVESPKLPFQITS